MTLSISRKDFPIHPRHKQMNINESNPFTVVTVLNMGTAPINITALELVNQSGGILQLFKKQKESAVLPFEFEATGSALPVNLEPKDFWDFGYFHSKLPKVERGSLSINVKYSTATADKMETIPL